MKVDAVQGNRFPWNGLRHLEDSGLKCHSFIHLASMVSNNGVLGLVLSPGNVIANKTFQWERQKTPTKKSGTINQ